MGRDKPATMGPKIDFLFNAVRKLLKNLRAQEGEAGRPLVHLVPSKRAFLQTTTNQNSRER